MPEGPRFTGADLLMADVLRVRKVRSFGDRPAIETYVTRVTDRAAFKTARADQLAHFAAADESRSAAGQLGPVDRFELLAPRPSETEPAGPVGVSGRYGLNDEPAGTG